MYSFYFSIDYYFLIVIAAVTQFSDYQWQRNGTHVQVVYHNPILNCLSLNIGLNESCSEVEVYQYNDIENEGIILL